MGKCDRTKCDSTKLGKLSKACSFRFLLVSLCSCPPGIFAGEGGGGVGSHKRIP